MADEEQVNEELVERSATAAGEAIAASEESPWGGLGYMMALSRWDDALYKETAQTVMKTVLMLFAETTLPSPGEALAMAEASLPDPVPMRFQGAKESLEMFQAHLDGGEHPGMRDTGNDEYLVGWWLQVFSLAVQLNNHADMVEQAKIARQN